MSAPPVSVTPSPERYWLTVRISPKEKQWVTAQASLAGLSQSEYLRRQVFHGRPVLALTDEVMLRELRRLGGLLKSNFVTLRQAGCVPALLQSMEQTLNDIRVALICISQGHQGGR